MRRLQVQATLIIVIHLVRRFFGHVVSRPLAPAEQAWVRRHLEPELSVLFFAQVPQDQRHALAVALRATDLGGSPLVIVAALVHDVGKRHADLGAVGRALATVLDGLKVPLRGRFARYRDHGRLGASDLERAGAPRLALAFAREHPGPVPAGIDAVEWSILAEADRHA